MNLLVSACLLGVNCRYGGNHCRSDDVVRLSETNYLIPVCPEQLGGLPTPREPSEIAGAEVLSRLGKNVTEQFQKGAAESLKLAELNKCSYAILKSKSPSCGCGMVYDGTFSGRLVPGDGVTTQLLKDHGIKVLSENELGRLP